MQLVLFYFKSKYSGILKGLFGISDLITYIRLKIIKEKSMKIVQKMYKLLGYIFLLKTITQTLPPHNKIIANIVFV